MNTKIFFSVFLFFLLPLFTFSQCYTVLSVKGEIRLEKNGQSIKEMDEVCAGDKIIFSTVDSKAAVLSPEYGRYVIKSGLKESPSPIVTFVKSALVSGSHNLSSKNIEDNSVSILENVYLIFGKGKFYIDSSLYKLDEENYFIMKYKFEGKEYTVFPKVSDQILYYNKEEIYTSPVVQEYVDTIFMYYSQKNKELKKIGSFKLIFADEEALKKQVGNLISILKKTAGDVDIKEECVLFIRDIYGNRNNKDTETWLEENFSLK